MNMSTAHVGYGLGFGFSFGFAIGIVRALTKIAYKLHTTG